MERACSLDPVSVNLCHNFAFLLRFSRRYERARAEIERGMSLDADHAGAYWVLGHLELDLGPSRKRSPHWKLASASRRDLRYMSGV